ncbi:MAG TPA: primosomal protein N' [Rhabdochlamydiaceae bacterium]|jgi:primosomal protein N' (replication factor Y)|nr:primosomal protein N' [Rhabdochlamydiaceae bacterium]
MENSLFAAVYVDVALDKPLDYTVPSHLLDKISPGARVKVLLQKRSCTGTVLHLKNKTDLKKTVEIQDLFPDAIPLDLLELGLWLSKYYCAPFFKVVKLLLPPPIRKGMEEKRQLFVQSLLSRPELAEVCTKYRGSQAKILEVLLKHPQGILLTELLEKAATSRSPVATLAEAKILSLQPIALDRSVLADHDFFPTKHKTLNSEQASALEKIVKTINNNTFETHLLYGVTSSGKTEVYLQAIDQALELGKSAIFLVPEIALTSQTVERLRSRFQEKVALLHHRLNDGQRRDTWQKIREGTLSLIVGPRSALFSPVKNLGLIIVDEEHDSAYKQTDEAPCYHARDVAVMRGKFSNAAVILGSATPSLESYANALSGKYSLSQLTLRADSAHLPTVRLIDMRKEFDKAKGFTLFSDPLLEALKKRIEIGEQSLIFLNRRGFHTSAVCGSCAHILNCPHCSISLTFHKGKNILSCHLCNYELFPVPSQCPECKAADCFKFKGAGTEQVERALHAIFPHVRSLRLDADTTKHKGSHDKLFKQFRAGKADVLIGTQMIAKGLHFPSVTLVGVLNADAALHIPDFRAAEHVFQLITQVSGRSGRSSLKGEVLLQTQLPDHPTIQHAARLDYPAFFHEEIEVRKTFNFPPACHLVKLTFASKDTETALKYGQEIRTLLISQLPPDFELHPVIPCGYAKIKDNFRFQCLIKGKATRPITEILKLIPKNPHVQLLVDVDPLSTFF